MSRWRAATICLAVISTASGYGYHSARGYENEQFSQNQQFAGSNNVQWSRTQITPNLVGIVRQGLGMINYDATNIMVQQMRQRVIGNAYEYKIGFQNPSLQQNCLFQLSYCPTCSSNIITPFTPACSSPCPGNVCRVDVSLRNLDTYIKSHKKTWHDRTYDENDYETRNTASSLDDHRNSVSSGGVYGVPGVIAPRYSGVGVNSGYGMGVGQGLGVSSGYGMGVGQGLGVSSGYGMGVNQRMGMGVGSAYGVGVGSGYGMGVGQGLGVGVGSAYGVGVGSGYGMGVGQGLGVSSGYGMGVGQGLGVSSGYGMGVNQRMGMGVGSAYGVGVGSGYGMGVGSAYGVGVGSGYGMGGVVSGYRDLSKRKTMHK